MRTKTMYEAMKGVEPIITSTTEKTDDELIVSLCIRFEKVLREYELEQMRKRILTERRRKI